MIGLEPTFDEHLDNLVAVFREVRRVLRDDATLWLNYGDGFANAQPRGSFGDQGDLSTGAHGELVPKRNFKGTSLKPKDLMMMPARVAMALQADGWWIRSEIIYHKKNPMPESVTDRPTCAHEKIFLMSKQPHYFYDAFAVRVPSKYPDDDRKSRVKADHKSQPIALTSNGLRPGSVTYPTANLRNVWKFPTHSYSDAHFATFPPKLVEPCIKAGTSEKGCCAECGAPWVRVVDVEDKNGRLGVGYHNHDDDLGQGQRGVPGGDGAPTRKTTGWKSTCECDAPTQPCVVLDCFAGAGTVGLVAERMYRDSILIEINKNYAAMARDRIYNDAPLLTDVQTEEL